jgi:hypothetical protein
MHLQDYPYDSSREGYPALSGKSLALYTPMIRARGPPRLLVPVRDRTLSLVRGRSLTLVLVCALSLALTVLSSLTMPS